MKIASTIIFAGICIFANSVYSEFLTSDYKNALVEQSPLWTDVIVNNPEFDSRISSDRSFIVVQVSNIYCFVSTT